MSTHVGNGIQPVDTSQPVRSLGWFRTYQEAEEAVDYLADTGFPVERVSIVGHGVKLVEHVTGRIGYPEAAFRGALAGGVTGALVAWLFGVFDWFNPVVASGWLLLDGLWFGAIVGALIGVILRALTQGRRDFTSVRGLAAERYELVVDEDVADQARELLEQIPLGQQVAPSEPAASGRPAGP